MNFFIVLRFTIFVFLLIILSNTTNIRNHIWQNDISLWSDVSRKSPGVARSHNNIGSALIDANRCDEAIPALLLSIRIDPRYLQSHANIAKCYIKKGHFDDALMKYQEVLRINAVLGRGHYGAQSEPRLNLDAHSNLGNIYNIKRMFDKSIFHYQEALKINPDDVLTHFNLAITYEAIGMYKDANSEFKEALKRDSKDEGALRGAQRTNRGLN